LAACELGRGESSALRRVDDAPVIFLPGTGFREGDFGISALRSEIQGVELGRQIFSMTSERS
jgi:hypothetical protein